MMAVKPILFSGPMVRALLEGRKTQTRRVMPSAHPKFPNHSVLCRETLCDPRQVWYWDGVHENVGASYRLPIAPGDLLWVREAHALVPSSAFRMSEGVMQAVDPSDPDGACVYREGWERCAPCWRPSIFMPRWASRLTLRVTDVRVQRLWEISEPDAKAEGVSPPPEGDQPEWSHYDSYTDVFADLWESLNAKRGFGWNANPWVAAYTFDVIRQNVDQIEDGK